MIKLEDVCKTYRGPVHALDNISTEIKKGEFVFLVGASGSGKSTFMKLVLKEEDPTEGTIWVAGKDIGKLPRWRVPYLRRNIGCVFQDFKLLPSRTVRQNVAFALEVLGRAKQVIEQRVPAIIELVGLSEKLDMFPNELSGGEQRRVCIARAMVNRPPILLADEPTGNLDPSTSLDIMDLLARLNEAGTTMIIATHDHTIVDRSRKRVLELADGRLIRDQVRGVYGPGSTSDQVLT